MSITTPLHSHRPFSPRTVTSRRPNAAILYAVSVPPEPRVRGKGRTKKQTQQSYESGNRLSLASAVDKELRNSFAEVVMEKTSVKDCGGVSDVIHSAIAAGLSPGPRSCRGLVVSHALTDDPKARCSDPEIAFRTFENMGYGEDYIKSDTESCKWVVQAYTRAQSYTRSITYSSKSNLFEASKELHGLVELVLSYLKEWNQLNILKVAGLLACAFLIIPSADAIDALKTCTCLLKECRIELAKCISNPSCAANIACLQTCNNRPDETECQIKCGDLFENSVVDQFNECAVSRKKCVPRKSDVGDFPVPDPAALVKNFNIADFTGKWFITSGLNPTFDAFDCQLHEFHLESNKLVGNLTWRIRTPDTAFFTRSAVQKFVQDPVQPGILYNHDNEYLHYQDDWYILSSKIANEPDDYVFVYYRGRNDAWDGYGGSVIYTRSATLPESIVPELERAAKSVGRDFSTFIRTDNTCGPEPPLVERIEKTVEEGERTIIKEVEEIEEEVEKVGKTEVTLFQRLLDGFKELRQDEENFLRSLSKEEMDLLSELKMEAKEVEELFGRALPIRKLR